MRALVRRHPLLVLVIAAVLMLGVGIAAGFFVRSPEQVAADAAPPAPTELTAPVQFGKVQSTETADAEVRSTGLMTVTPAVPVEAERAIVSAVKVKKGDKVEPGEVLVEVAGRPTFVMQGKVAAYRTLGPGMSGTDVAQLQDGLREAGYQVDSSEGRFGSSTKAAIEAFYADHGYGAVMVGTQEAEAAEEALTEADRAVTSAETTLKRAERDYAAETEAATNRDAVDDAQLQLDQAREDRAKAATARDAAASAAGPQVPLGEVSFLKKLPAQVDKVGVSAGGEVGDGVITLATGELSAVATFSAGQAEGIAKGNPATIITTDGTQIPGSVASHKQLPERDGETLTEVIVKPDEPFDKKLAGAAVRADVATAISEDETLMVPEAAIATAADGTARVRVKELGEDSRDVAVLVGDSGNGLVGVTPLDGAALEEGDNVVVGILR